MLEGKTMYVNVCERLACLLMTSLERFRCSLPGMNTPPFASNIWLHPNCNAPIRPDRCFMQLQLQLIMRPIVRRAFGVFRVKQLIQLKNS